MKSNATGNTGSDSDVHALMMLLLHYHNKLLYLKEDESRSSFPSFLWALIGINPPAMVTGVSAMEFSHL